MSGSINIKEIRRLAKKFSPKEIENCISQQLEDGTNACEIEDTTEEVINQLSKANFVRQKMEEGVPLMDAVRDLAKRIRQVQEGFANTDQ